MSLSHLYTKSLSYTHSMQKTNEAWYHRKAEMVKFSPVHHKEVILLNNTDVLVWEQKVSPRFIFYWQISLLTRLRGHFTKVYKSWVISTALRGSEKVKTQSLG